MLKLNKLEKQTIRPAAESMTSAAQLCSVAVQFEDAWERKDIEFDADLEDAAYTQADPGLLELVWTNLLSNAVKFTPQGGSLPAPNAGERQNLCFRDRYRLRHG